MTGPRAHVSGAHVSCVAFAWAWRVLARAADWAIPIHCWGRGGGCPFSYLQIRIEVLATVLHE